MRKELINELIIKFVFFIVIIFYNCSSSRESNISEKGCFYFGWAGPPENINNKPHDYYYKYFNGRSNKINFSKRSESIKSSCITNVMNYAKDELIARMISDSIYGSTGGNADEFIGKILVKEFQKKENEIQIKRCNPLAVPNPSIPLSEYKECQCIIYIKYPGGQNAIIERAKEIEAEIY